MSQLFTLRQKRAEERGTGQRTDRSRTGQRKEGIGQRKDRTRQRTFRTERIIDGTEQSRGVSQLGKEKVYTRKSASQKETPCQRRCILLIAPLMNQ